MESSRVNAQKGRTIRAKLEAGQSSMHSQYPGKSGQNKMVALRPIRVAMCANAISRQDDGANRFHLGAAVHMPTKNDGTSSAAIDRANVQRRFVRSQHLNQIY